MKKSLSFEAACKITGDDPTKLPDTTGMTEITAKRKIAEHKIDILYRAAIKGKIIELTGNLLYTPWFSWVPSLRRFVCTRTSYTYTGTRLGARFWFETATEAKNFGEAYIDLINDLMAPGY